MNKKAYAAIKVRGPRKAFSEIDFFVKHCCNDDCQIIFNISGVENVRLINMSRDQFNNLIHEEQEKIVMAEYDYIT